MRSLPPAARAVVERLAEKRAVGGLYLAGGVVRDLLRGEPTHDFDIVLEDDAIAAATEAASGLPITAHERFGTATIDAGDVRIDVSRARSETYAHPGALPAVAWADIESDLRRRDFSINAMAVRLNAPSFLDPCGGAADLEAGLIRVLHDCSFVDDPTRIFRAPRYAARLSFAIEPHTAALIAEGVRHIPDVSGERLRHELELIFREQSAPEALDICERIGALRAIHRALHWNDQVSDWPSIIAIPEIDRVTAGFALLSTGATAEQAASICERLRLTREEAAAVHGLAAIEAVATLLGKPDAKPSGIVVFLDRFPLASVAAFAATHSDAVSGKLTRRYLHEWRHVRPLLRGDDLIDLGVPVGPRVGNGLQLIRAARLDGWAQDRDDERALAMRFAKSIRDSNATSTDGERSNGH